MTSPSILKLLPIPLIMIVPIGGFMMPSASQGTPTYANVILFGVPAEAVEPFLGSDTPIVNFVEVYVDRGWWTGTAFAESLRGRVVESGNAYHIGAVKQPGMIPTPETILVGEETDKRFPLRVVNVRWDPITIAYETQTGSFITYFATVPSSTSDGEVGPGVIAIPSGGWIGRYVLGNGVMISILRGWTAWPVVENAQVRVNGSVYNCSLVYVYYFPWAH